MPTQTTTLKTAILYTRVSSADQVQGTSLETQERELREWCDRNGCKVIKHFQDAGESAKTADRPGLIDARDAAKKLKADVFVVWKLDRLSRDTLDGLIIQRGLRKHGCELVSISEPIIEGPLGEFQAAILLAVGKLDNDERSRRSKKGMAEVVRKGGWCWLAPTGYKISRNSENTAILMPDGVFSIAISKALRGIASGTFDKAEAINIMVSAGMTRGKAHKVFGMPIYGGLIRSKISPIDVNAAFSGIVTPEVWYAVETATRRTEPRKYIRDRDDFPLAGVVTCGTCGLLLWGYFATGRKAKKYPYYRCKNNHVNIRATELEELASKILHESEELGVLFEIIMEKTIAIIREKRKTIEDDRSRILSSIEKVDAKITKLTDAFLENTVPENIYKSTLASLNTERERAQRELEPLETPVDYSSTIIKFKKNLENITSFYDNCDTPNKKKLLKMFFGGFTLQIENKKLEPQKGSIYQALLDFSEPSSQVAPPRGIEPLLPG